MKYIILPNLLFFILYTLNNQKKLPQVYKGLCVRSVNAKLGKRLHDKHDYITFPPHSLPSALHIINRCPPKANYLSILNLHMSVIGQVSFLGTQKSLCL